MKKQKIKIKWVVVILGVVSAVIVFAYINLKSNLVYFYTPGEAVESFSQLKERSIRIGGLVKPGSVEWERSKLSLKFILTDTKGTKILVEHHEPPPDLFKENQGVIVEGKILDQGKRFFATSLMVKHSEEYQVPSEHETMNKVLLEESIFR